MNTHEIEYVISSSPVKKYTYFIKKTSDFEEIRGLFDSGWALTEDDSGNRLLPLWPKKEFAELCICGEWSGYKAKSIPLDEFINEWIPACIDDNTSFSVFMYDDQSILRTPQQLLHDLNEELEKY